MGRGAGFSNILGPGRGPGALHPLLAGTASALELRMLAYEHPELAFEQLRDVSAHLHLPRIGVAVEALAGELLHLHVRARNTAYVGYFGDTGARSSSMDRGLLDTGNDLVHVCPEAENYGKVLWMVGRERALCGAPVLKSWKRPLRGTWALRLTERPDGLCSACARYGDELPERDETAADTQHLETGLVQLMTKAARPAADAAAFEAVRHGTFDALRRAVGDTGRQAAIDTAVYMYAHWPKQTLQRLYEPGQLADVPRSWKVHTHQAWRERCERVAVRHEL